jgi:hypothetical protein
MITNKSITIEKQKYFHIDNIPGERYIEQFNGYTLDYITGKSG